MLFSEWSTLRIDGWETVSLIFKNKSNLSSFDGPRCSGDVMVNDECFNSLMCCLGHRPVS